MQGHEMSYRENGVDRLAHSRVATDLQFVKQTNKNNTRSGKWNKMRYAYTFI